ncbi:MAG: DUF1405 domain-containing protein [Bacillota bacterium]|uniref:DUF1405 domain-containing protein n=1 Tax=Fictibacillus TaxID=1329200 RepID=UPI0018CF9F1C|nr:MULTISPECIES: DUF1405 domain-containing protein [unclassified Fictibacillus]MBH0157182.1 DUF1405 domain-containing protein [Fictibacillus sp. 5RED26]MBH0159503.1 DUF1405 domain-containing protein [Fictibacillus sp. 26RED30]MBH0163697.1 DUF1405 domain-containing protein [Fictibacillus sp. 7GRE50]MBH0169676.1 DUF1405 domain-containing protein [Fictibacillus sp. 18YEL24]MBH0174176.1 DUF1405 domain-containing protein [Fictibacillus sp. 23RED33]
MNQVFYILKSKTFLSLLLTINILGTIYGYIWYGVQLTETPSKFLLFVPDSPTASLFFVIVLFAFLVNKNLPIFEGLAIVTLFKYGIWAVFMNILVFIVNESLNIVGMMLILSHLGMAIQGLLYAPFYKIKPLHLTIVAIWTLHNDVIDYVFFMMPRYSLLNQYTPQIGYFTFWLSIGSILLTYYICIYRKGKRSI